MQNLYPPSVHELQHGKPPAVFPLAVNNACAEIKDACKALGVDEKALSRVLSTVTPDDRTLIAHRYKELYLEELKFLLKSEVSGDFGFLLQLLAVSLDEAEAYVLHAAVTGPLNTGQIVFPVLLGRTNAELAILKKTYFDIFNQELSAMVNAELGGDLRKIIIIALQTRMAPFDPSVHTNEKAEHDAEALYKSGEGKWGTDEEGFTKIVLSSPPEHLAAIDAIYGNKYASSIKDAVEKEFSGDAKDALTFYVDLALDRNTAIANLLESTMAGFGTNEKALAATVIRYHPFLAAVAPVYEELYGKPLKERIAEETSGDFEKLLVALLDAPTSAPFRQ